MKCITLCLSLICIYPSLAQTTITGTVTDEKGTPITGANVYLQNTYDGISTDSVGNYAFSTEEKEEQILVISAVGFAKATKQLLLSGNNIALHTTLRESIDKMEGVVINAGAFEASDRHKAVVLSPMDIVSTAGALGDVVGAINTLPGTQTVGESGRLFIRGSESYETKVFIDGTKVHQSYNSSVPNVPTRGRFSPLLFEGTTFSTGGYSAEYEQALSSVLILDTIDFPDQTQTDISLMSIGGDIMHQQLWETTSLSLKAEYANLFPYMALIPQDFDWEKAPESAGTALVFRQKTSNMAPRLSLAYKTGENSQASLAYGEFYQTPENDFLKLTNELTFEHAHHWIANYQLMKNDRIFRIEAYWKNYNDLIRFDAPLNAQTYTNAGDGFARGIDIFWRDKQTIKNGDYWISYSLLDTQRNYRDFPTAAMPGFASRHNFSIVYKHFITERRTQFGGSYSFASGRPYGNPNSREFHADFTKPYHIIRSSNQCTGERVFGYEYTSQLNELGVYERMPIKQGAKRFLFAGLFITLTKDKKENQLDNL